MSQPPPPEDKKLDGAWSHGRFYGKDRPRRYLGPIDEEALRSMDIFHKFFLTLRRGDLFRAPVRYGPGYSRKIMDLGTGTGIWAIDVAETIFSRGGTVHVMAADLIMIQPQRIPFNMMTYQLDLESASWGEGLMQDCDLIHMRLLYGSIRPQFWPHIYRKIFEHLQVGSGHIEHAEIDWEARWDRPAPPNSALDQWSKFVRQGWNRLGRNADVDSERVRRQLIDAGFVGIQEEKIRCYLNPKLSGNVDESEKWLNIVIRVIADGMSLVPLIEGLDWEQKQVTDLCEAVRDEIQDVSFSGYFVLYTWTAVKPHQDN